MRILGFKITIKNKRVRELKEINKKIEYKLKNIETDNKILTFDIKNNINENVKINNLINQNNILKTQINKSIIKQNVLIIENEKLQKEIYAMDLLGVKYTIFDRRDVLLPKMDIDGYRVVGLDVIRDVLLEHLQQFIHVLPIIDEEKQN